MKRKKRKKVKKVLQEEEDSMENFTQEIEVAVT